MTVWVLHAMLLGRRIEVATRRREARGIALTDFVDVDGVNSRTQICNRHRHLDAAFGCCELRLAGIHLVQPQSRAGLSRAAPDAALLRRGQGCSGSSKNGHRRDSLPTFGPASQRPNWALLSSRATAPEEVHYERNHRYD